MSLKEVLGNVDLSSGSAIDTKTSLSWGELLAVGLTGSDRLPPTVVVSTSDPLDLLSLMLTLDGEVNNLALVSAGTSHADLSQRMAHVGEYVVVSNDSSIPNSLSVTEFVRRYRAATKKQRTAWLLSTSGTTAIPKLVSHSVRSLTRTTRLNAGDAFVWGQLYDPCRFAGLQVVLQAVLGGSSIVFPNPQDDLSAQLAFLAANGVNALSATPTLWRKILMTPNSDQLSLRTITLGGEIADDRILAAVARSFTGARVRHIYASTEAGTGFSVTDGKAGFPIGYLDGEHHGTRMRIVDDTLLIHAKGGDSSYVGENRRFADADGFINTGDQVCVEGDRVFFLGRTSGVINVGGNKVYPEHVESVLAQVPTVELVRVVGKDNSVVGQLVVAEVLLSAEADQAAAKAALMQVASAQLQKHERPFSYQFVDNIEHSTTGKVQRR